MNRIIFLFAAPCLALLFALPCAAAERTFRYEDPSAAKVEIVGDFNKWEAAPMTRDASGVWTLTLDLPPGVYGYKFLVNGEVWTLDPANPARTTVAGIENSSVTVDEGGAAPADQTSQSSSANTDASVPSDTPAASAPGTWTFSYSAPEAEAVFVAGSFNGWNTQSHPMSKSDAGVWTATVSVPPGQTTYKFIVDGEWKTDPANPQLVEDGGGGNNSAINAGDTQAAQDAPATSTP